MGENVRKKEEAVMPPGGNLKKCMSKYCSTIAFVALANKNTLTQIKVFTYSLFNGDKIAPRKDKLSPYSQLLLTVGIDRFTIHHPESVCI